MVANVFDRVSESLQGRLVFFAYGDGGRAKLVLAQITSMRLDNPFYQDIAVGSVLKKAWIPHVNIADRITVSLRPIAVYEVGSAQGGRQVDAQEVYSAVLSGANVKHSGMYLLPPSGTKVYLVDHALQKALLGAVYGGYNIVYLGHAYGSDLPAAFNLSPFTNRTDGPYKGIGEARMIGVFGQSGSGKSWLAAYLLVGYARNPGMGILVLDPQGQFASNFSADAGERMPFHEMLRYACGREVVVVPTKDLRVDPSDTYAVSLLLGKFVLKNLMSRTNREKQEAIADMLMRKISVADVNTKWLNPVAVYGVVMKAVYDNNPDVAAKELGMSVDEVKDESKVVRKLFEKFIEQFLSQVVKVVYSGQTADEYREYLNTFRNDPSVLGLFSSFLRFFDVRSGKSMNEVLDAVLNRRAVVLVDLSDKNDGAIKWMDPEDFAALYIRLITERLRQRAEAMYKGGELLNVLIAIDEAHRFVGEVDSKDSEASALKKQIVRNVRETRKYGIGWLFITQSMVNFSTDVYRQLHDVFFMYGLGVGADEDHIKEKVPGEYIEVYRGMPNPKVTGVYWAMHTGSLGTLSTTSSVSFIRVADPGEFLRLNFGMSTSDLQEKVREKEQLEREALNW